MALPVVKTLAECADFSSTVEPYLYQLRPLPQIVFESIANPTALKQIYLDTNPFISALGFAIAIAPIFLIAAEINQNYSQVDRFWSIIPPIYAVHYTVWAHAAGLKTEKLDLMTAVILLWGTRLTFNYWRRGGYQVGSEDYRWIIVKNFVGQPLFFIFDVLFISLGQMLLLFSVTMPGYILLLTSRVATIKNESALDTGDLVAAGVMAFFVMTIAVSDQQQWNYQTAKQKYKDTAKVTQGWTQEELDRGFRTRSLWAYSRHPNFACEQSVWISLHAWCCYSSHTSYNWTAIGVVAYLALFQASTWLTEMITADKYPEYKEYQQQVSKFWPLPTAQPPKFSQQAKKQSKALAANNAAAKARDRYDLR